MAESLYTPKIINQILDQLKEGKNLTEVCNQPGMPKPNTIKKWAVNKPEFKKEYTKAKEGHQLTGAPAIPYNQRIVNEILLRLSQGETLVDIVKDEHIPGLDTIYKWRRNHPLFADEYVQARQDQADTFADKMNTLAVKCREELKDLTDPRLSNAWKETYRMELDALKWTSSKLKPQLYGDKAQVDINSQVKIVKPDSIRKSGGQYAGTGKKPQRKKK